MPSLAPVMLGPGFTFFSGATEAWLVDGLNATGYRGSLDAAFAKGQVAAGIAMLGGTIGGGFLAQWTNLGVPYLVRAVLLQPLGRSDSHDDGGATWSGSVPVLPRVRPEDLGGRLIESQRYHAALRRLRSSESVH